MRILYLRHVCLLVKHSLNTFPSGTKSNVICPLAKFWLGQLMLIGPHKNFVISSIVYFPKNTRIYYSMPWFIYRSATSRGAPVHYDRLFSTLLTCVCLRKEYVSLSNNLRAPALFTDSTACFLLLAVACLIVYSARILEEFHLIRRFLSPTISCLPHIPRQGIVVYLY